MSTRPEAILRGGRGREVARGVARRVARGVYRGAGEVLLAALGVGRRLRTGRIIFIGKSRRSLLILADKAC